MIKLFSLLLFGLLVLNTQALCAKEQVKNVSNETGIEEVYNFNDSSNYITDEQLQDAQEIDEIDDKAGFEAKIINSSHFSSGTATKTYIPINKVLK